MAELHDGNVANGMIARDHRSGMTTELADLLMERRGGQFEMTALSDGSAAIPPSRHPAILPA